MKHKKPKISKKVYRPLFLILSTAVALSLLVSVSFAIVLCNQNTPYIASYPVIDCIKNEGVYEMYTLEGGCKVRQCILPDGTVCTDSQYYANKCYK